jgi:hypothetical protein
MATHTHVEVVDDLDASTTDVGTYRFTLEGVDYEIDLSAPNADRLRDALAPYIAVARRLPKTASSPTRRAIPTGPTTTTKRVRAWWAEHEPRLQLPAHRANGPISASVYTAYQAAN